MRCTATSATVVNGLEGSGLRAARPQHKATTEVPVNVGAISSAALFAEATSAVRAYFNNVKVHRGWCGREGEVARESATRAFKSMSPREVSLTGSPFSVGASPHHNPHAMPVWQESGRWRVEHCEYITCE